MGDDFGVRCSDPVLAESNLASQRVELSVSCGENCLCLVLSRGLALPSLTSAWSLMEGRCCLAGHPGLVGPFVSNTQQSIFSPSAHTTTFSFQHHVDIMFLTYFCIQVSFPSGNHEPFYPRYPSIYLSIHVPAYPSAPPTHLYNHPSTHPFSYLHNYPLIPLNHSLIHYLLNSPFIRLTIHLCTYPPSTYLPTHPCIAIKHQCNSALSHPSPVCLPPIIFPTP